jgi:Dirigent-like protein
VIKIVPFIAAAALAAVPVAAQASTGPGKPTVVLHFLDVTTHFTATFPDNREPAFGDRFAFTDDIYRWHGARRGARVGHATIDAVVIGPNLSRLSAVAYLPGGTLVIFGDNSLSARSQKLSVIGGTGIYATARGELLVRNIGGENTNNSAITVRLWM